jgi:hypothetical protein
MDHVMTGYAILYALTGVLISVWPASVYCQTRGEVICCAVVMAAFWPLFLLLFAMWYTVQSIRL